MLWFKGLSSNSGRTVIISIFIPQTYVNFKKLSESLTCLKNFRKVTNWRNLWTTGDATAN